MQNKCFKQKVVVLLTFVTIYLIWNPKPDKDNTCTTIHYHEGDTPLRNVCRSISALRTAYRHVLASRTAYRLKTKQPFWEFHLHKEDKMTVWCMHIVFDIPQINVYVNKCRNDAQKARA